MHSPDSVAKMARGEPLNDGDRWPWLDRLRAIIDDALAGGAGLVLACSALKASYRARLAGGDAGGRVRFVHLAGTPELFRARLAKRAGHFMKPAMLDSQLATLEVPGDAITVDAAQPVPDVVAQARAALGVSIGSGVYFLAFAFEGERAEQLAFYGETRAWMPRLVGAGARGTIRN